MQCPTCRSTMDAGDRFCARCGAPAHQIICTECGNPNHRDSAFCIRCGHELVPEKPNSRIIAQTPVAHPPTERKFVTILRADLVQSTQLIAELDPEQAVHRLAPALAAMRAAVRKFGGIVSNETGDGLAAVFGAPFADDNHAPLACHAAIELVGRVADLRHPCLQVRVGLHSGLVIAQVIANEFSKVYELAGPAHALAARLEAIAQPGQIYASQACQALSVGYIRFDYLGIKPLKGFAEPVAVYRVADAVEWSSLRVRTRHNVSPFVGRSTEMAFLRQIAEDTLNKSGRFVYLRGDAGIGKSRLVREFVDELAFEGWRVIEAECSPVLRALPFAALKRLLLSALDPYVTKGHLSDANHPRTGLLQTLRSALDAVLDLPVSDPQWHEMDPHLRRRAISEVSRAIVEHVATEQPTVLLIEDLHWVDSSSDVVIESFLALTARHHLLVLVSSRPNDAPEWLSRCNSEQLWLQPLDDGAGRAMLDAIVGSSPSTLDLKSRIIRHTGNVPLFIEEVCRRLRETGVFQGEWGSLVLDGHPGELGVPATVLGVIAARIDRLPEDQRTLLQIAAAIGTQSTLTSLRDVSALREASLQRCLWALDQAQLLVTDSALKLSYEFPHELMRHVAYESMLEATREGVHGRILTAFESAVYQSLDDQSDTLCHHATRAKDWLKALTYARNVARKCISRSAFSDATTYFDIAMDALDRTPTSPAREAEAIDLRFEARNAFMGSGRLRRWLDLATEAEQRADLIGDAERKVAAITVQSGALNFSGTPLEAVAAGERAVREAERSGVLGWLSLAEYHLGLAHYIAGHYREAERMLDRACAPLQAAAFMAPIGTPAENLSLLCCFIKSLTHTMLGELDSAELFQRQAQRIADQSGRPYERIAAAFSLGTLLLGRGDPRAATTVLDGAFALAQQHDVRIFMPLIACHRGNACLEEGRPEAAQAILADAREAAGRLGHTSSWLRASIYLALALCESGDPDSALRTLRGARNTASEQGFEGLEAEALYAEAKVLTMMPTGEVSAIICCLRASIAIAMRHEARPQLVKSQALLGRILAGDVERSLQSNESAGSAASRNGVSDATGASAGSRAVRPDRSRQCGPGLFDH